MILLKYGNTNTYFVDGLLIDTDMPGTLPRLYRELKRNGLRPEDIRYVIATHWHPDHVGLIGELTERGAELILADRQLPYVHSSDPLLRRMAGGSFTPADEGRARVVSCGDSRALLASLGIAGELVPTDSHSPDGIALLLDDGSCFVGDLEPRQWIGGYGEGSALAADWARILPHGPAAVHFGHANSQILKTETRGTAERVGEGS